MYEKFHEYPTLQYIGEYDDSHNLINVFNSLNQKLKRILGTYQWYLIGSDEIYFVEEDPIYKRYIS